MSLARSAFFFAPWLIAACGSMPRTVASPRDCAATSTPASADAREDAYAHYGRTGQFIVAPNADADLARPARTGDAPRLGLYEMPHSFFGRTGQYPNELSAVVQTSPTVTAEARTLTPEDAYAFHGKTDQFPSSVTATDDEVGRASCQR